MNFTKKSRLIILLSLCIFISGCSNQPPKHDKTATFNLFCIHYYECQKCGSLDGGTYSKESVSSYRTEKGEKCYHEWIEVSKDQFNKKWKEKTNTENLR